MKQWTEEDLILFYYQELEPALAGEISQAMNESHSDSFELRQKYQALCKMLDNELALDVPAPHKNLNQQIMVAITASESNKRQAQTVSPAIKEKFRPSITESLRQKLSRWLAASPDNNLRPAYIFALFALVGIFYLGRLSVAPVDTPIAHVETPDKSEQSYRPSADASRRILLTNVSSHIETSQRLLTLVSNGVDGLPSDIEPRRQMIEELISFNRLYRRMAEHNSDNILANVLQQMESVLLEINHTKSSDNDAQWKNVRDRLDETDLLFKLKVTDKKINQELI